MRWSALLGALSAAILLVVLLTPGSAEIPKPGTIDTVQDANPPCHSGTCRDD